MARRYKSELVTSTIASCISDMYSEAQELASELQEVVDAIPENLQEGTRSQTLQETISTLEGLSEPSEVENMPDAPVTYSISVKGGKKRGTESRATRASNIAACGRAGAEAITQWIEDNQPDDKMSEEDRKEREDLISELEQYADEVGGHADEIESCEYPGMMG
jgi:cell division septum initiation protein DivIVA